MTMKWRNRNQESLRYLEETKQCRRCIKFWEHFAKHYQKMLKKDPEPEENYLRRIRMGHGYIKYWQNQLNKYTAELERASKKIPPR